MGVVQSTSVPDTSTLLDVFYTLATNPSSSSSNAVECAQDALTHAQLWSVSNIMAVDLVNRYGRGPVVAIISENHPYTLAMILGVWMTGGVVAPFDAHAPETLMEGMLAKIEPDCVVLPATDEANQLIAHSASYYHHDFGRSFPLMMILIELNIDTHVFHPEASTIPALLLRPQIAATSKRQMPLSTDIALYIFTSSASSPSTLKSVPLSHNTLLSNCQSQLAWLQSASAYPTQSFSKLRVLGWAPLSHIMALSHDLGTYTLLTGGCYIFAITPSTYPVTSPAGPAGRVGDAAGMRLRDAILTKAPHAFGGVPWVLEELMALYSSESDTGAREHFAAALRRFKVCITAGAKPREEVIRWAVGLGVRLVEDIGMTEFGGTLLLPSFCFFFAPLCRTSRSVLLYFACLLLPVASASVTTLTRACIGSLFRRRANPDASEPGWALDECIISDAQLTLVNEQGEELHGKPELPPPLPTEE